MAIVPSSLYPAQTDSAAGYPQGKARNSVTFQDGTGTPLEKAWLNDVWGFLQALLSTSGVAPSGIPDDANESQYLQSLVTITDARTVIALRRFEPVPVHLRAIGMGNPFADVSGFLAVRRLPGTTFGDLLAVKSGASDVKRLTPDDDLAVTVGTVASITSQVVGLAFNNGAARIVAIGTGGNRCCFSINNGATWSAGSDLGATPATAGILWNQVHLRFMVAFAAGANVAQDADGSSAWSVVPTVGLLSAQGGIAQFSSGDVVVCGLDGASAVAFSRSVNGGVSWAVAPTVPNAADYTFESGWIDGNAGQNIYHVGRVGNNLRVCSATSSMSWSLIATIAAGDSLSGRPRILMCPNTGVLVIVAPTSGGTAAFVSRDGGETWSTGIRYQPRAVSSFAIADGRLFSSIDGVLYSTDKLI